MTRLQKSYAVYLGAFLVAAAFVAPWAVHSLQQSRSLLVQQQEMTPQVAPPPVPVNQAEVRQAALHRAEASKAAAEQAARIQKSLKVLAVHPRRADEPPPPEPAHWNVPPGSPQLSPLEGWVDKPKKTQPGRVHTNLMWRWASNAKVRPLGRRPCLKLQHFPAQRIQLSYGWVNVHARTIPVACGAKE